MDLVMDSNAVETGSDSSDEQDVITQIKKDYSLLKRIEGQYMFILG